MYKTNAGEKRKALKAEALELAKNAKAAMKAAKTLQDAREKVRTLDGQADSLKAEAEALKGSCQAGISLRMGNGEDQDHQERQDDLRLLDCFMERGR